GRKMNYYSNNRYDAIVVGSGPNGLAAAIRLALEGLSVKIFEAEPTVGGGTRTLELTRPGFRHDICSAIHPMAISSPFFRQLPLGNHGLEWIQPPYPLAHPLDGESAVILHRDIGNMIEEIKKDFSRYHKIIAPLSNHWEEMTSDVLAPLGIPAHPFKMASFGLNALQSAERFASRKFNHHRTKALFTGLAAHSIMALDKPATTAIGLVLGAAGHAVGWPLPRGGSQSIADALSAYFKQLGGEIETGIKITHLEKLPDANTVLFDLTPKQVNKIVGDRFSNTYRKKLQQYRYGAGVFKIDYILKEPVPWTDERCSQAGTVHVGGLMDEIVKSESLMSQNRHPLHPYVLVAQQSLFDNTRTPNDKHTLWAYCHVPHNSNRDMIKPIEDQIERFAPGFRDVIEVRSTKTAQALEAYNANYIGGDINGGAQNLRQLFSRPVSWINPYATPAKGIYFCSSSTPPGGGVHGMCGFHAAESALKKDFGLSKSEWQFHL
ncbi:MAG: NAD(P)/FAD-dependent oxidoreductase, partial [Balneolaceae bacterium]